MYFFQINDHPDLVENYRLATTESPTDMKYMFSMLLKKGSPFNPLINEYVFTMNNI